VKEYPIDKIIFDSYIEDYDLSGLDGLTCSVDFLQETLESIGFFSYTGEDLWYENVLNTSDGYVAYMKAVSPQGQVWKLTVDAYGGTPYVTEVERIREESLTLKIIVEGGCVQEVRGMPFYWSYIVDDRDFD